MKTTVFYLKALPEHNVSESEARENWDYVHTHIPFSQLINYNGALKISSDNIVAVTIHGNEDCPEAFDFHKKDNYKSKVLRCIRNSETGKYSAPVSVEPNKKLSELV